MTMTQNGNVLGMSNDLLRRRGGLFSFELSEHALCIHMLNVLFCRVERERKFNIDSTCQLPSKISRYGFVGSRGGGQLQKLTQHVSFVQMWDMDRHSVL